MYSLRRWLYRPKRSDSSLLAQFYFADEELNLIAAELDSFEGRKDPERCTAMVNQLRACQARVLSVVSQMMDETVKEHRAPRDFRVKFPDDVIQENLAGQLWFGAECLAAGSCIMNREVESACMRPLARALTKNLDSLRTILREQCLQSVHDYTDTIKESLIIFDKLFAEFELSYVSAMVPVKTAHEYDMIQEITVLFSETVQSGVLIFKDGPLNPDNDPWNISEMFRPFQTLLLKIRELLSILTEAELMTLERALCSQEEPSFLISLEEKKKAAKLEKRKSKEDKKKKKDKKLDSEGDDGSVESELTALEIAERLEALALNFEASRNGNAAASDQAEPDTQSKSSEISSGSASSILSEGEAETASREVELEDAQVQHFTNQLYYEANLDSQSIYEDALSRPLNGFASDSEITSHIPSESVTVDSSLSTLHASSEAANSFINKQENQQTSGAEVIVHENGEESSASTIVKCNSNDSGLHSEVVSNSGSMYTISSSDSNHLMTSPDTPTLPESFTRLQGLNSTEDRGLVQNGPDESSKDTDLSQNGGKPQCIKREDSSGLTIDSCDNNASAAFPTVCGEDADAVQNQSILSNNSENSASAMSTARGLKIDTGQEKIRSKLSTESVAVSNPSGEIPQNQLPCPQSSYTHSSTDSDNQVSQVHNTSDFCDDSISNSAVSFQNINGGSHSTPTSKDIAAQNENVVQEVDRLKATPVVGGPSAESSSGTKLEVNNNNSTNKSSPTPLKNSGASSAAGVSNSSASTSGKELPQQESGTHQKVATSQGVPHSATTAAASVGHKYSVSSKRDGKTSSKSKGKLKRGSGVKGKRSSVPSRTRALVDDQLLDGECCNSSETSSYTSDCGDQEEIALAIEAVESATRQQVRARFRSSSDMIHRLFVCISGVADQLQTNFAGDLRNILRSVFDMNCSEPVDITDGDKCKETTPLGAAYIAISNASRNARRNRGNTGQSQAPPAWVPDEESTECMSCQVPFSFVRRRHHCRNCGKIFCSRCSSNFVPLPHFGQEKCVRVCNRCFMFRVTPFTVRPSTQ
ncbi:lateral signaling target protein 2 homolog [Plakobranchus ocellatus]|uniref:Lateral signaling target protein 2 homolog n=1 Tax=Plakobranchus ocellatus TaxID=259542 RepID=A0AAV4AEH7_9GAST|nr:lateral signaling target protein 2 homolog [Plakobranchus ocellatus]